MDRPDFYLGSGKTPLRARGRHTQGGWKREQTPCSGNKLDQFQKLKRRGAARSPRVRGPGPSVAPWHLNDNGNPLMASKK